MPCATTLSATVTVSAITSSEVCGSPAASTTTTPNTIDASPRGPNQPRNSTVGVAAWEPSMESATGTIRTSVRLSTAYPSSASPICDQALLSTTAPNTISVTPLST